MSRSAMLSVALLAASCAFGPKETIVAVDENGAVEATLPDGTAVGSIEEYEAAIEGQVGPIEEMESFALTVTTKNADGGTKGAAFGKFRVRVAVDGSYLEGCIRKSFLHLKILVENANISAPLVELHLVAFFEGGKPCFAVMNTGFVGYGWCQKVCVSNPKDGIKTALKGGMIAAGIGATTAAIMAALLAPVASVAFAM